MLVRAVGRGQLTRRMRSCRSRKAPVAFGRSLAKLLFVHEETRGPFRSADHWPKMGDSELTVIAVTVPLRPSEPLSP